MSQTIYDALITSLLYNSLAVTPGLSSPPSDTAIPALSQLAEELIDSITYLVMHAPIVGEV